MRIRLNSPVLLTYTIASTCILILSTLHRNILIWFIAPSSFVPNSVQFWITLFSHSLGHISWSQLINNFALILLIGPRMEDRHGRRGLALILGVTALVTGILSVVFHSTGICGSNSITFALILLSSFVDFRGGEIPATFLLIFVLYIGREVSHFVTNSEETNLLDLVGGICGSLFGYQFYRSKGRF
jgi:membrane associated rhomboid family serine protease